MPDYLPSDPKGFPTDKTIFAPYIFFSRPDFWRQALGQNIDDTSSDPRTLNFLSDLIAFTEPHTIVEVGTYRGWGTAVLAETLRVYNLPGHVWSCDPIDHGVIHMLEQAELSTYVTLITGTFEDLLPQLSTPIDLAYIDASAKHEPGLRLRYTKLALEYLAPHGLIVVDDTAGDWKGVKSLRRLANLTLPQNRGLTIVSKRHNPDLENTPRVAK